jgi:hypothetical protein
VPVAVRRGRFTTRLRLRRPGLHRLRVTFAADARNAAAQTSYVYLRARRGR